YSLPAEDILPKPVPDWVDVLPTMKLGAWKITEIFRTPAPQPSLGNVASSRISELDALRAFAALSILFHHFVPSGGIFGSLPETGWIGVDLFLVLSGFFITNILLEAKGKPHYFKRFYVRRALRIVPLYYLVVVGVLAFARYTSGGSEYRRLLEWG